MSFIVDILAVSIAFTVGFFIRRYFIYKLGPEKTNLPFIKEHNLLLGSKNIIFCNDKILAHNAHDRHKELGPTFGCYFGANMQVFSADPDLIYKICVTDFPKHRNRFFADSLSEYLKASLMEAKDNDWQHSRKIVASVLKPSKLKLDNVDVDIDTTISKLLNSIDNKINDAKINNNGNLIMDIYQLNKIFFMESILRIVFNTQDLVDFDSDYNPAVEDMYNFINVNYEAVPRACLLVPQLTNLFRPIIGFLDHGKYLTSLVNRLESIMIKEAELALKRANLEKHIGEHQNEHLQQQQQQKQNDLKSLTTIHSLIKSYKRGELDRNQLMGNAIFLMMAGFATSTDAMSALLFELAKNQSIQDKLRKDIQQYGENSKFLEQCINETLRLYPGAMPSRTFGEDVYFKRFKLLKNSFLHVDVYTVHRDPKYWGKNADLWNPDNFEASKVAKFHPAQFIPFGIGPRNCVGYHLAKMELNKYAAQLLIRYKFELCSRTQSELENIPLGALPFAFPIKGPIDLKVTRIL